MESVEVTLVGGLKRRLGGEDQLKMPAGQTVRAMLAALEVDSRSTVVMVNGRRAAGEYVLRAGDQVKLMPLMTGG